MMMKQVSCSFRVVQWDEKTWDARPAAEVEGRKLTQTENIYTYTGDLEGQSAVRYTMTYNPDGTGNFIGLEHFSGRLHGLTGDFVLIHNGTFDAAGVQADLTIAPGSGTGALAGIRGVGQVAIEGHQEAYPCTLQYTLG